MDELLKVLLNRLEAVGRVHEELYDSECREQLSRAIFDGFLKPQRNFKLPDDFGLYSVDANTRVREALGAYIADASARASVTSDPSFHDRLEAFQNHSVRSDDERLFYDDFFGYWRPEHFDQHGEHVS